MNVRRRASAALISSCVYKLSAGKGCLESLVDADKSDAVVLYRSETGAGEAGSVTSEGDADSKGTTGSMESSGDVKEVQVVRSSGLKVFFNSPSGDPDMHFKDLRGNNTHPQCCEMLRIFSIRGSSLWILCTESGPLEA